MRILFVSPRLCFPLFNGARLREYYLARALSEHAEVTYASFVFPGFPVPTQADLPFLREIHILPLTGRNNPLRLARGLVGRWPLTVVNYTRAAMKRTLAEILARQKFDLVHLDGTYLAGYVPFLQAAGAGPVVFDWHNIESELLWRYSASMRFPLKKIYAAITARRMAATEAWLLRGSLGHTVCSAREQAQLLALAPTARVEVIDNGVDTDAFSSTAVQPVRDRIIFVGALNYHPNIEAAVWFARRVWPRVSASFPHWRLTLVGCHPSPAVRELAEIPGVEVTGTVADVRPYYREAVAAIVPLLTGSGTRLKILEGMAAGVPVVSSSLGAEGLAVSPGNDVLIADGEDAWLPALSSLAADSTRWDALSAAGSQLVRARYDWRVLGERLYQTYARWLKDEAR